MGADAYEGLAARYDWMSSNNPARERFFLELFKKYGVSRVLDCACGTGEDLLMFHRMADSLWGSDLSDAMLARARQKIIEAKAEIPLLKADYRELPKHFQTEFDAVVCLSNAINEPLEDTETVRALLSMKSVLRSGGILVFDQGQSDVSMRNSLRFDPVVNNRDYTRFFVIDYAGDIQTINIFDFIHTEQSTDFFHSTIRVKIRLQDSWWQMLGEAGFEKVAFFGDWKMTPYDRESSRRLIVVAEKS
ncbi:MAG: methyltransferase domain-containing protein [Syntrophotaleaceae bacterium]